MEMAKCHGTTKRIVVTVLSGGCKLGLPYMTMRDGEVRSASTVGPYSTVGSYLLRTEVQAFAAVPRCRVAALLLTMFSDLAYISSEAQVQTLPFVPSNVW
jgi:hypothetical protein